jgi:pantoate--beta-alanine ligase
VVVSIFVNPTQFGPKEDFSKYPRTFDTDCELLEEEKVDILFAPGVDEMYPSGSTTFVTVDEIGDRLDGASRPGHFRGVATVVAKLFHIVGPDKAYFGQKDAAQVAVLRRMVRDLNFPLEMVACPTVREPDGLAMSSRNRYLLPEDRTHALVLSRALFRTEERVADGTFAAQTLVDDAVTALAAEPHVRLDYFRIVDPDTLLDVEDVRNGALIAVAAFVGSTRLIDNILIAPR